MRLSAVRQQIVIVVPLSAIALFAPQALADCASDAECERGFSCEVTGISGCTAPACLPGSECPEPEPCQAVEFRDCVPAMDCVSDADCADGMVCFENSSTVCTSTIFPCSPNGYCPPPTPEACTTTTQRQCTPRYFLPCTLASDCGEGFTCEEQVVCTGVGLGEPAIEVGAPDVAGEAPIQSLPDGGTPPSPPPPECLPSGTKACQMIVMECSNADACPSGWRCEASPVPACAPPAGAPADVCPTQPGPATCVPPYGYAFGALPGAVAPPGAPESPDESAALPTASGPASVGGVADTSANAPTPLAELAQAPDLSDDPNATGNCAVALRASGPTPSWLLLGIGLLGLARRRRG